MYQVSPTRWGNEDRSAKKNKRKKDLHEFLIGYNSEREKSLSVPTKL